MDQWAIQFSELSPDSCKNIIQKIKKNKNAKNNTN